MILTDTHTHLHFADYARDAGEALARAREAGVRFLVCVGTHLECSEQAVRFSERDPGIFAAVGCHPHDAKDFREADLPGFERLLSSGKVRAIGEVGLDFYRNLSPQDVQERVFRLFLGLHRKTGLPLILHVREAHARLFEILREEMGSSVSGLMHCFSGNEAVLEEALAMGLFISVACNITYPRNGTLRDLLPKIPLDRLLLETDSPFLPPQALRGKRNEPAYLVEGARAAASQLGIPLAELASVTTRNAGALFRFAPERGGEP